MPASTAIAPKQRQGCFSIRKQSTLGRQNRRSRLSMSKPAHSATKKMNANQGHNSVLSTAFGKGDPVEIRAKAGTAETSIVKMPITANRHLLFRMLQYSFLPEKFLPAIHPRRCSASSLSHSTSSFSHSTSLLSHSTTLSVTQQACSVTQQALSVTQQACSVTQ